jgi:hypothetical protein
MQNQNATEGRTKNLLRIHSPQEDVEYFPPVDHIVGTVHFNREYIKLSEIYGPRKS